MPIREAARRRDLTINAIMYDRQTDTNVDPWGGVDDLHNRQLRPVDAKTFLEDPLRALRAAQFAARLGFTPTPDLTSLSRTATLNELPAERVQVEWEKLLLKGSVPSLGFAFARQANILQRVFPEAAASDGPDVDARIDAMVSHRESVSGRGRRWALMLAAWLRGLDSAAIDATLDRLWLHRVERYDLRPTVHALASRSVVGEPTDRDLRELSTAVELDLALRVAETLGTDTSQARVRAHELGVLHAPPPALVQGRDLMAAGIRPGPRVGELLRETYAAQLRGELQEREDALAFVLARASLD
jgi:tRNA nucleotidyltransferase (CCA-adding enzyme)